MVSYFNYFAMLSDYRYNEKSSVSFCLECILRFQYLVDFFILIAVLLIRSVFQSNDTHKYYEYHNSKYVKVYIGNVSFLHTLNKYIVVYHQYKHSYDRY